LQEKELQEEKRRKKHTPEFSGGSVFGDNYYHEDGGNSQCLHVIFSVLSLSYTTPFSFGP
jgi:hypothetical protein